MKTIVNTDSAHDQSRPYHDFQVSVYVVFFRDISSALHAADFEISSASDPAKLKTSDDRNGSVTVLDALVLLDRYPPPPRSTCKWASRRSLLRRESA